MSKYDTFYCDYNTIFKGSPIGKTGDIIHHTLQYSYTEPHTRPTPKPTCTGHRSGLIRDTEAGKCWGGSRHGHGKR